MKNNIKNKQGLELDINLTPKELIKESYKKGGYLGLPVITPLLKSGYVRFRIKKFNKVGFIMDIDLYTHGCNYNLSKKGRENIKYLIEKIFFNDIENKDIKNKLKVGESFITCSAYEGDEVDVFEIIFGELNKFDNLERIKLN